MVDKLNGVGRSSYGVGYVRVSAASGDGSDAVEAQKRAIQDVAGEHGIQLSGWFVDEGHSGVGMDGPALRQCLDAAHSPDRDFDVLVVESLDRLSRDKNELETLALLLEASGVRLVPASDPEALEALLRVGRLFRFIDEGRREVRGDNVRRGFKFWDWPEL